MGPFFLCQSAPNIGTGMVGYCYELDYVLHPLKQH